jgi:SgrR family transcriptional regulator
MTFGTVSVLLQKASRHERLALLQRIESELLEQNAVLPLYRTKVTVSSSPFLSGVQLNAQGWVDYRSLWFKSVE